MGASLPGSKQCLGATTAMAFVFPRQGPTRRVGRPPPWARAPRRARGGPEEKRSGAVPSGTLGGGSGVASEHVDSVRDRVAEPGFTLWSPAGADKVGVASGRQT